MTEKKSRSKRRMPRRLGQTLYCYVEPVNGKFARQYGAKNFGSFSAYIDTLIALDRKEGFSKASAISASELRESAKKSEDRSVA